MEPMRPPEAKKTDFYRFKDRAGLGGRRLSRRVRARLKVCDAGGRERHRRAAAVPDLQLLSRHWDDSDRQRAPSSPDPRGLAPAVKADPASCSLGAAGLLPFGRRTAGGGRISSTSWRYASGRRRSTTRVTLESDIAWRPSLPG